MRTLPQKGKIKRGKNVLFIRYTYKDTKKTENKRLQRTTLLYNPREYGRKSKEIKTKIKKKADIRQKSITRDKG